MKKKISITLNEKTLNKIDSIVDLVYIRNRSQAIEHLVNNALGENRNAVILAGGSESHQRIGEDEFRISARIGRTSVVELAVRKLREEGFKRISIVARHNVLTAVFSILGDGADYGVKMEYTEEKESSGTASSLALMKGKIKSNFLVVYGDIVFNRINIDALWNQHLKQNAVSTLLLTTSSEPSKKGIVVVEGSRILRFLQKPKKSDTYLVFSPIFVAEPEIFNYIGNSLETDVFPQLAERGLLNGHISSEREIHIHSAADKKKVVLAKEEE